MKFFIFTQFTAIILAITFTACKSSPKEQITEAYKFRHKAVFSQTRYLADEIGQTYTDKDATMEDLKNFIKKSPRVEKVTLASVPMVIHPFSISLMRTGASPFLIVCAPKAIMTGFPFCLADAMRSAHSATRDLACASKLSGSCSIETKSPSTRILFCLFDSGFIFSFDLLKLG